MAAMARDLIVTMVGVPEETTSHLRLLMRQAAPQLERRWRWGGEAEADLVVVDPDTLAGQVSRTRCEASGVRCALVCAPGRAVPAPLVLQLPLRLANVVDVLRRAAEPTVSPQAVGHQRDDFYAEDGEADAATDTPSPRGPRAPVAKGLEELMRDDPGPQLVPQPKVRILDAAGLSGGSGGSGGSTRSEQRSRDLPDALARSQPRNLSHPAASGGARQPGMEPPPGLPPTLASLTLPPVEGGNRRLAAYLAGGLLGGPAQIRLDGMPSLTLDPKHHVFHSEAPLSHLARYCTETLPRNAWRAVTSNELAQLRTTQPPRLYEYLVWLETLMRSGGRLAPNLDPGGSYRLRQAVEVDHKYHSHGAIAHAMRTPTKLNEIAGRSGASMETVFDVVNAYAAIGWLEWKPRERLQQAAPEKHGLWSRLKWPFGKD